MFEWKTTLKVGSMVDVHDKTVWNKSTILEIKDHQVTHDRTIPMCLIGYRIYLESGIKNDDGGAYDGWSNRFDESVSLYSPKI